MRENIPTQRYSATFYDFFLLEILNSLSLSLPLSLPLPLLSSPSSAEEDPSLPLKEILRELVGQRTRKITATRTEAANDGRRMNIEKRERENEKKEKRREGGESERKRIKDEEETSRGVALILWSSRRLCFIVPRKRFHLEGKIDRLIDRIVDGDHVGRLLFTYLERWPPLNMKSSPTCTFGHVLENLVKRYPRYLRYPIILFLHFR